MKELDLYKINGLEDSMKRLDHYIENTPKEIFYGT